MQPVTHTVTRLVQDAVTRRSVPVKFDITIDLAKLDPAVFVRAVLQERVRGMNGALQIVRKRAKS